MKQNTITKFTGLHVAENSQTVPDGALERANNVIINQDNLIQKRRGLKPWHTFQSTQHINTLFAYENSVFALSQDTLYRFDSTVLTGTCSWVDGSKTISVGAPTAAHGITNGDFIADFYIDNESTDMTEWTNRQTDFYGFHAITTTIAPGVFTIEATNPPTDTTPPTGPACYYRKYSRVSGNTISITDASRIAFSNGNAYFTSNNGVLKLEDEAASIIEAGIAPGLDIISLTLSLTSDTTPKNTGFLGVATTTLEFRKVAYRVLFGRKDANNNFVLGAPGDYQEVENNILYPDTGLGVTTTVLAGTTLTVTTTNVHNLLDGEIIYLYFVDGTVTGTAAPVGMSKVITLVSNKIFTITINDYSAINSIKWQTYKCVSVKFTLPSEVNSTDFFYRVYRTTQGITINDDFRLIEEKNITTTHIANHYVTYLDEVYDELITNTFLYTNANAEGSGQANGRPPLCKDLALFKNSLFYANCTQYALFQMNLISADRIVANSYLRIADSTYRFVLAAVGSNYPLVTATSSRTANVLTVTSAAHGMENGEQVYLASQTAGTNVVSIVGAYTIFNKAAGSFDITLVGTFTGTITDITYNKKWILLEPTNSTPVLTVSEAINNTARNIVFVINQDSSSLIYSQYTSTLKGIPGELVFYTKNFTSDFYIYSSENTTKTAFTPNPTKYIFPNVPTLTADDTKSDTSVLPNALYISKPNEPEAVPLTNFLLAGSRDKAIIRIAALRDSLIILKEDGVFRLNGDSIGNFSATLLDGTVEIKSANSLAILNNSVYCLSNQGIVQITDSSVRVISRAIEPLINSILGDTNLPTTSAGAAYESERTYMLSCKSPNTNLSVADNTYVYNYLTDGITTASDGGSVFKAALLNNKEDKLYTVDSGDVSLIYKERKDQKKTDYLGDSFCVKVDASIICNAYVTAGTANISVTSKVPHGLLASSRITISNVPQDISTRFAALTDIEGIRSVVLVTDEYTFTFDALTVATGSIYSYLNYQNGVSEYVAVASVTNTSATVVVTTNNPHGFITAQTIKIDAYTITETTVPENASITYISPTSFSFKLTAVATGTETKTVTISDKQRNYNYLTLTITGVQPQAGDGLVNGNNLYPIDNIYIFGNNKFVAYTTAKYDGLSTDLVFLGSGIRSIIRFSPVTLDAPNELKYFSEFTATFKNNSSFTKTTLNFANDFVHSTDSTEWDLKVGTDRALISFGGWGQLEWGEFPWGGEYSVNRDFLTRPAVVLRTYVPKDVFVGTFIQPIIYHNKAGESIDLQSIGLFSMPVTARISR